MDNVEIWKDIPHYEGLYQVSNQGRVWSVRKNRLLKQSPNAYGYLKVCLYNQYGKSRVETVHRLVALAFIDQPSGCNVVNHLDENRLNNCVENLEWTTIRENVNYGTSRQRQAQKMKGHTVSEETKQKMSEARKKYWQSRKENQKCQKM